MTKKSKPKFTGGFSDPLDSDGWAKMPPGPPDAWDQLPPDEWDRWMQDMKDSTAPLDLQKYKRVYKELMDTTADLLPKIGPLDDAAKKHLWTLHDFGSALDWLGMLIADLEMDRRKWTRKGGSIGAQARRRLADERRRRLKDIAEYVFNCPAQSVRASLSELREIFKKLRSTYPQYKKTTNRVLHKDLAMIGIQRKKKK